MFARILPAVMLLLLYGSSAQAGLMLDGMPTGSDATLIESSASVVMTWMASQGTGGDDATYVYEPPNGSGMSSAVFGQSHITAFQAVSFSSCRFISAPGFLWSVAIRNSVLPGTPVLDGLLKPS